MSTNTTYLQQQQPHNPYPKLLLTDRIQDKTRTTQQSNISKLCQNCRIIKEQLQGEIFLLKDKSHQSFMQVIQVQQLHQQEMDMIRQQHYQEVNILKDQINGLYEEVNKYKEEISKLKDETNLMKSEITRLQQKIQTMRIQARAMQTNYNHHKCQLNIDNNHPSFLIQNIDIIKCSYNNDNNNNNNNNSNNIDQQVNYNQLSKLDESQLKQFNQIIVNNYSSSNKIIGQQQAGYQQLMHHVLLPVTLQQEGMVNTSNDHHNNSLIQSININNNTPSPSQSSTILLLQQKITTLTQRIHQLQLQTESLFQTNQQLKKQSTRLQISQKSSKNNYQSLYKQSKFMADHIRGLANDKFKLQRKVKQLQKQIRQNNLKISSSSSVVVINSFKKSPTFDHQKHSFININNSSNSIVKMSNSNNKNYQSDNQRHESLFASDSSFNHKKTNTLKQNSIDESKEISQNNLSNNKYQHQYQQLQQQQQSEKITITKVLSIENFNQPKLIEITNPMTQSQYLHIDNKQFDPRKSMPSYKKVSHISPSPSFKKPILKNTKEISFKNSKDTSKNNKEKSPQFMKLTSSQQFSKQDMFDKSDFMDEIRKQIELKVSIKKTPITEYNQIHRPSSLFHDLTKKRSNTKN